MNHFKKKRTYYRAMVPDAPAGYTVAPEDVEVMARGGEWRKVGHSERNVVLHIPVPPGRVAVEMVMVEITELENSPQK